MFDPHANLIRVTVTVAPTTPTAGTTLSISDTDAAVLDAAGLNPSTIGAFNATVHPFPTGTPELVSEIVRLTAKGASSGGNTQYTIARQTESGGINRSILVGDKITISYTKKTIVDIENTLQLHSMARQAVINGNFNIWQRNTSVTSPASASFLADRWKVSYSNSGTLPTTIIHSRQALTPGDIANAYYFYRINPNGAGSGFGTSNNYYLAQLIENGTRLLGGAGKKVTVSFYARSSIAGKKIGVAIDQGYGTGGSPSADDTLPGQAITLTSTWAKYTVTFSMATLVAKTFGTNNDDRLALYFFAMWGATIGTNYLAGASAETFGGSGNIDIAQVQVCAGDIALNFQPRSYDEELGRCQRYYQKSFSDAVAPVQNVGSRLGAAYIFANATTEAVRVSLSRMRIIPTVTTYNPSAANANWRDVSNSADRAVGVNNISDTGFELSSSAFATSSNNNIHWTADAEL